MERFGDRHRVRRHHERAQPDPAAELAEPARASCATSSGRRSRRPAARPASGVPPRNVMLPEEMDAFADGMTAGHVAARAAIKARRPDLPVGLSLAIMDDVVVGGDPSVRDRKRAEVYERWLELARDDDFIGVQNYERIPYDGARPGPTAEGAPVNQMGSASSRCRWAARSATRTRSPAVPVLVTEHGMSTADDTPAGRVHRALAGRAARRDGRRRACPRLLPLDAARQLRVDLRLRPPARPARGRPETFVRTPKPSAEVYAAIAKAHAVS